MVISVTHTSILLAAPATATNTTPTLVTFTSDNGGSQICDSETPPTVYQRTTYSYSPKDWGAFGASGGGPDDTVPVQNWINAIQPHIGDIDTYTVDWPLGCPAYGTGPNETGTTIQGQTNVSGALFGIAAGSTFSGLWSADGTVAHNNSTQAVLTAQDFCRLSGVNIAGNQQVTPLTGSVSTTTTITFSSGTSLSHVFPGNTVTDMSMYVPTPTTVSEVCSGTSACTGIGPTCSATPCVVISQTPTGTNSGDSLFFWGPDALDIQGLKVTVDGSSSLLGGRYNIDCGDNGQVTGLELKDSEASQSTSDNIYLPQTCSNVRLVGDNITNSGGRGVYFGDKDISVSDGIVQQSSGIGLDIEGADLVSVTGMTFTANGMVSPGGAAIQIKNSSTISICGNHFKGSNAGSTSTTSSHVFFQASLSNFSFCGNTYEIGSGTPNYPNYVYDAASGTTFSNASFYENPGSQALGVLSPNAASVLPSWQVTPALRSFLTGLTLSTNLTMHTQTVSIASGAATDSTGVSLIQIPAVGCSVNLGGSGLGGLDTGSVSSTTTYFFFVVADQSPPPSGAGASPSCIASAGLAPTFGSYYGHPIYRLVGALYTDGSSDVVQFTQNGDTFYLTASVTDIKTGTSPMCASSIGTSAISCPLSVPCGRNAGCTALPSPTFPVEAFGRIVGGSGGTGTNQLLLSSLDQADQTPAAFPTAPGNTNSGSGLVSTTTPPVYPFHLHTDGAGNVRVRASASSITAFEVTDGWVWHRQQ